MGDEIAPALYTRAIALGAVAGMRSMMPFAFLAVAANRTRERGGAEQRVFAAESPFPLALLRSRLALLLCVASVGEVVVDKLPFAPSRLEPGPLAVRCCIGALVGAAVWRACERRARTGAVLGAAGALGGSLFGNKTRVALVNGTGVPDPVWALAEDVLALGAGIAALRPYLAA